MNKPKIKLRQLKTMDVFPLSRILKKIGIRELMKGIAAEVVGRDDMDAKEKQMQLGIEMLLLVFENLHLAETEVTDFLAKLAGMSAEEFKELEIGAFLQVIAQLREQEGIEDFLESASK